MSLTAPQQNARLGTALAALAMRYFELVAQQNNAAATEVRRAFTTLYLSRGGRAALVAANASAARVLPTTLSTSGWSSNLRIAMQFALQMSVNGITPAVTSMPTGFNQLATWWRGGAGAQVMSNLNLSALEVLMDFEGVLPQQASLLAVVDVFTPGPGLPVQDPWQDTVTPAPAPPEVAPAPTVGNPSAPVTGGTRRCPSGFVRVNGECIASVEAGGSGIVGSDDFVVRGRVAGEFPLWATLLLTGLGVGGVAWFVLTKKRKRGRR